MGMTSYVYAGNNPANNSDPSGRAWWQLAAVIAITVIVTVVAVILTGPGAGPIAYAVAGMLSGAIIGASAAAIYGQNVGEAAARGAIIGAITGAAAGVGSAIGSAATAANAVGAVVTSVVVGALIGAVGFGIAGFDPAQGAIAGAIAGGMAAYRAQRANQGASGSARAERPEDTCVQTAGNFSFMEAIGERLNSEPPMQMVGGSTFSVVATVAAVAIQYYILSSPYHWESLRCFDINPRRVAMEEDNETANKRGKAATKVFGNWPYYHRTFCWTVPHLQRTSKAGQHWQLFTIGFGVEVNSATEVDRLSFGYAVPRGTAPSRV